MCFSWAIAESRASQWRSLGVQMWTMSNVGALGHLAEIGGGHVGPQQSPSLLGSLRSGGDDLRDSRRQRQGIVVKRQGRIAIGMHAADHAETENADTLGSHGHGLSTTWRHLGSESRNIRP